MLIVIGTSDPRRYQRSRPGDDASQTVALKSAPIWRRVDLARALLGCSRCTFRAEIFVADAPLFFDLGEVGRTKLADLDVDDPAPAGGGEIVHRAVVRHDEPAVEAIEEADIGQHLPLLR